MLFVMRMMMRWEDFCAIASGWEDVKALRVFFSDLTEALGLPSFMPALTFPRGSQRWQCLG